MISLTKFFVSEVFRHEDVDGTVRHFSIPILKQMLADRREEWTRLTLPIDRQQAAYVTKHRGVEEAKVRSIPLRTLDEPGIILIWDDESMLTVDGNHRLVKRVRRGLTTMDFWACREEVWRHSLVDGNQYLTIR